MVDLMLKRSILSISPIVIGLLAGCATKQTWVPELEDAQNTYAQISQDPIVASLAEEDLRTAARQLERAQDAAASFRKPQTVAHQARIAKLQTLTAQQRARSLSANHSLQVALGQNPLLSQEKIAAATIMPEPLGYEPTMAAGMPGADGDVQAQLAALSQQIANLQLQLAQSQGGAAPQYNATAPESFGEQAASLVPDDQMLAPLELTGQALVPQVIPEIEPVATAAAEPVEAIMHETTLAAAMPVEATDASLEIPTAQQIHRNLRAMNAKPHSRGMSLMLGERYFDGGSDRLMRQRAARHLDNVAAVLKQNPGLELLIEGHTDNRDSEDASHDLSVNRAISIKSALVLRGVDAGQIATDGFGQSRPIADNDTTLGRLQNRRVELIFPVTPKG